MVIQSNGYSLVTHISAVCIWTWTVIWLMRWLPFCSNTSFVHVLPHWCFCNVLWKNVAVSDVDLSVYSEWIRCEEETTQMQWLLCVCIGATSVRRWVTWNRDEHNRQIWACHNMTHVANKTKLHGLSPRANYMLQIQWLISWLMMMRSSTKKWSDNLEQHGVLSPKKKAGVAFLANMVLEVCGLHVGWFLA